jgi:hypothetical protein
MGTDPLDYHWHSAWQWRVLCARELVGVVDKGSLAVQVQAGTAERAHAVFERYGIVAVCIGYFIRAATRSHPRCCRHCGHAVCPIP